MPNHKHVEPVASGALSGIGLRKSAAVPLMLAAGAMLTGCSKQDEYDSLASCTKEWARPELCQPKQSGSNWLYTGPKYSSDDQRDTMRSEARTHVAQQAAAEAAAANPPPRTAPPMIIATSTPGSVSVDSSHSVARGGFGESGHATSSHGGSVHVSSGG